MRIPRIYQAIPLAAGDSIALDKNAGHHLTRVLRMQDNESVILFNGQGGEYSATLKLHGKDVIAEINSFIDQNTESSLNITLLQGISKGERMDIVIQKAVELGVKKIIPVLCQRTVVNIKGERSDKKHQHWQGIILNACEQSGRTRVPELAEAIKLGEAFNQSLPGLKLTLNPTATHSLHQVKPDSAEVTLLIGPEGGLDEREIVQAEGCGFQSVRMGPRILRTETAALAAITALQTLWGDLH